MIRRHRWYIAAVCLLVAGLGHRARADVYTLWPSDDGYVTPSGQFSNTGYLLVGANGWDGVVKFALPTFQGSIDHVFLSINPYGLPLWGNPIDVYGYETQSGMLDATDFHAGTFLGSWQLPPLGYGQDAFFEVTAFLQSVSSSFVGFTLRSGDVDVLSSLHYNYGHPSELIVTTLIPEPSSVILGAAALPILALALFRRRLRARLVD